MGNKHVAIIAVNILLIIISASNLFSEPNIAKTKVVFAYEDKNNFPYYLGQGITVLQDKPGVSVEFLMLLEKKLHMEIKFVRLPWKRCLIELGKGKVDGIFNASFRPERLKVGVYPMAQGRVDSSRRLTTMAYVLYKLKPSPVKWDPAKRVVHNLKGEICAPRGYSIVGDLKKWSIPVYELNTTQDCFTILASGKGRFSGIATLEPAGDFYLGKFKEEFKEIVKVHPPLIEKDYYLMLSKQFLERNPRMAEEIWSEIEVLRDPGFQSIMSTYLQ